ncbi:MAG: RHS repeat-associated core domain-containing protein [Candidatus Acidiferrum sp.]
MIAGLDANGNTIVKTDSTGSTSYTWDFENRLASVTLPGSGGTVTFKYDPFGRRVYKSSSSATSVYAYDRNNLIEETNSTGAVVAHYSQALNIDEPLAMLRGGTTSFYHADGLGSVTSLSNVVGALAQTYTLDSFGKLTNSSGSLTNPFQFTARESDAETGLYYYRARYYDPSTGRFLSEDPLRFKSGVNFYSYVKNSAVNLKDPYGLCDTADNPLGLGWCISVCHAKASLDRALCLINELWVADFDKSCLQTVSGLEHQCIETCYADYGQPRRH